MVSAGHTRQMRALGVVAIVFGLGTFWILAAIYGVFDTGKRLAKKDSRSDAVSGLKSGAKATGQIAGGIALHYLLLFGGIFVFLLIAYGLGLG